MTILRAGFFSLTSPVDEAYLRWHLLDHLPEQHTIPGIRLGTRWRADDTCVRLRWAASAELEPVRDAVCYLLTDPVDATLHEFVALAQRLREAGRMPHRATPHLLGAFALDAAISGPVHEDALPFRPHDGVVLLVEEGTGPLAEGAEALLAVAGVAGVLSFRASEELGTGPDQGERFGLPIWDPGGRSVTVVYLDDDVEAVAPRLTPALEARWQATELQPVLAMPFRSLVASSVPAEGLEPTLSSP